MAEYAVSFIVSGKLAPDITRNTNKKERQYRSGRAVASRWDRNDALIIKTDESMYSVVPKAMRSYAKATDLRVDVLVPVERFFSSRRTPCVLKEAALANVWQRKSSTTLS